MLYVGQVQKEMFAVQTKELRNNYQGCSLWKVTSLAFGSTGVGVLALEKPLAP